MHLSGFCVIIITPNLELSFLYWGEGGVSVSVRFIILRLSYMFNILHLLLQMVILVLCGVVADIRHHSVESLHCSYYGGNVVFLHCSCYGGHVVFVHCSCTGVTLLP